MSSSVTEAATKRPPFSKRHIQIHFLPRFLILINISLKRIQFTIFQHWFRQLLSASQATCHCVNQPWPNFIAHIWPQRFNISINRRVTIHRPDRRRLRLQSSGVMWSFRNVKSPQMRSFLNRMFGLTVEISNSALPVICEMNSLVTKCHYWGTGRR